MNSADKRATEKRGSDAPGPDLPGTAAAASGDVTAPRYVIGELVSRNPIKRIIYFVLGLLSLVFAGIGIVAPVIPTVGPVILAAFFFARSSPRFEGWLLKHPMFGHHIIDYRAGLGISMRVKRVASAAIIVSFTLTTTLVGPTLGLGFIIGMVSLGLILLAILWAHRTKPEGMNAELVDGDDGTGSAIR